MVPHEVPSVARVHAWLSGASTGVQAPPPLQLLSVRVRPWVPLVAHVIVPAHVDHAEYVDVPHVTPTLAKPLTGHVAAVPVQRSSTSHPLDVAEASRHTRLGPSRLQTPSALAPWATLHASQSPPQAVLQHTPSTQFVDVHSVPERHDVPSTFFAEQ